MWYVKTFKTLEKMQLWISKNSNKYQYHQLYFASQKYFLEVRKVRVIDIR
jgi:hypothetical protein